MARIRLDKLLVKRDIANTQEHAREIINSGLLLVNGSVQKSTESFVDPGSAIEFVPEKPKFVSRGGLKLEKALREFALDVQDKRCLDIGASTGGFTDCLLQNGASHVVALDVGHGQLDLGLRQSNKATVIEKTNAKVISPELIGGKCSLATMDVSFTSVIALIDPVVSCLHEVKLVILIKPQFECEQKDINSRGIVTDTSAHYRCIENIMDSLDQSLVMTKICTSPIKGAKGNIEYLCLVENVQDDRQNIKPDRIKAIINEAFEAKKGNDD